MKYFYDTEFLEDGRTIELISIGIVCEDGREYYAVNRDAPWDRIHENQWLVDNVVSSLPEMSHPDVKPHSVIRDEVYHFLRGRDANPELWAWYAAYDHVALCQLWGRMIDLPDGIPMFTNDLKQVVHARGNPRMPEQVTGKHNALEDARHLRKMHGFVNLWTR